MFHWLKSRKKSLAEKTLDAMEKQRSRMTPAQLEAAEATFQKITEEAKKPALLALLAPLVTKLVYKGLISQNRN